MTCWQIKPHQAARLRATLGRQLHYIVRLRRRMDQLSFDPGDPLYRSVCQAQDCLQELHVLAHYCACTSGVASPRIPAIRNLGVASAVDGAVPRQNGG